MIPVPKSKHPARDNPELEEWNFLPCWLCCSDPHPQAVLDSIGSRGFGATSLELSMDLEPEKYHDFSVWGPEHGLWQLQVQLQPLGKLSLAPSHLTRSGQRRGSFLEYDWGPSLPISTYVLPCLPTKLQTLVKFAEEKSETFYPLRAM